MVKIGLDEAGKGPVIGPMILAGIASETGDIPFSVSDSKSLSTKQIHRKALKMQNCSELDSFYVVAEPEDIDSSQNLNQMTGDFYSELIDTLSDDRDTIIVDAYTKETKNTEKMLNKKSESNVQIEAHHKADSNYDIVSAASILAKSIRESRIDKLSEEFGDIGSGYPSDPNTREYLIQYYDKNREFPDIVRQSWSTVDDIKSQFD